MGLLTVPKCRSFPSVARSSVHCMDSLVIHEFLIIVHGLRPWKTSLSSVHGQWPWTTSLSSMGDFVVHEPYSRPRTFLSLLGVVLDPVCFLRPGRSLWTNRRWTNFSLSHQLPLCSKGHPGYWRNLKLIYMGLPLWATCRKIIGWPSVLISFSKGNATCRFLNGVHRFTDTVLHMPRDAKLLVGLSRRSRFPK